MISLENISSRKGDEILFTNLNGSFETGRIHGIWNEAGIVATGLLRLLAGDIPLSSGVIRYNGERLDHADVVYYNRMDMLGLNVKKEAALYHYNNKLVYLFDDIFNSADMISTVCFCKAMFHLKKMGRTILITSTDYKALKASTDFFHILSKGVFQAKLHLKQYDLLDDVFRHMH